MILVLINSIQYVILLYSLFLNFRTPRTEIETIDCLQMKSHAKKIIEKTVGHVTLACILEYQHL